MMARPAPGVFGISSRRSCDAFLILTGLVAIGCALSPIPQKMYEGPPLPKEQIGILHSGCHMGSGLTIMTTQIDGKDIADGCADFALSPGDHHIELSAKQLSPKLEKPYVMSSGTVLANAASSGSCGWYSHPSRVKPRRASARTDASTMTCGRSWP